MEVTDDKHELKAMALVSVVGLAEHSKGTEVTVLPLSIVGHFALTFGPRHYV